MKRTVVARGLLVGLLVVTLSGYFSAVPVTDLGAGTYLGFQGGLYEGGSNTMPADHAAEGLALAAAVQPIGGKIVLLSVGMSNTAMEWCVKTSLSSTWPQACTPESFMGQVVGMPVNPALALVNGAAGSQDTPTWDSPTDSNYDRVRTKMLDPRGLTEAQVQVVWLKTATMNPTVSLPASNAEAYQELARLANVLRTLKVRYPNLQQVFMASRIYAGYSTKALSPEPYAYEYGLTTKWLIGAQIQQQRGGPIDPLVGDLRRSVASWVAWGPYLWADGTTPRSDGLTWLREDFQSDKTHPSAKGVKKVADQLLGFFASSPMTPWFRN